MSSNRFNRVRLLLHKNLDVDVFEESDTSSHKIGRVSIAPRDVPRLREDLTDLFMRGSVMIQEAGGNQAILDYMKTVKFHWDFSFPVDDRSNIP